MLSLRLSRIGSEDRFLAAACFTNHVSYDYTTDVLVEMKKIITSDR